MKCFALFVLCSCFTVNFAQNHKHFHGNDNQGLNDNQSNSSFQDHDISSNQSPGEKSSESEQREFDQSDPSFEDQLTLANQSANDWHAHMHVDHIFNSSSQLEEVAFKESGYFIEKLFKKYGSHNSLPFPGLRQLMKNIGLAAEDDLSMEGAGSQMSDDRKSMEGDGSQMDDDRESMEGGSGQMDDDRESMEGGSGQMSDDRESMDGKSKLKKEDGRQDERKLRSRRAITHTHSDHSKCHYVKELLTAFHFDLFDGLDLDRFLLLCPALIDQLDNSGCHLHVIHDIGENSVVDSDHDDHSHHEHEDHEGHDHAESEKSPVASGGIGDVPPLVWVYSSVAVLGISLVGLLGVAAIPIIRKMFYKSLLQFLVALAVGALSGDALLHLLPHALSGSHNSHKHSDSHSSSSTSNNSSSNNITNNSIATTTSDDNHDDLESVWKGLVALGGLLFFFLAERVLTIVGHRREKRRIKRKLEEELETRGLQTLYFAQDDPSDNIRETAILSDDDNDDDDNTTSALTSTHHHHHHHDRNSNHHHHDHHQNGMEGHQKHDFPPQGQGHDHGGHGHSHHHGDAPVSLTAVAAMVIMGDGIHNFSDGLAIGAAFAAGMTGGFSTTVAVFCHELPHEIGDFAMLLSAGMSIKHAVMYNVLSSILCFVGMVIGVVLGQVENASSWIFCGVAGMFLYISMADMLPQLTIRVEKGLASPCQQLMLQCAGVGIGAGIMLTIAIFEHDLKTLIDIS